MKAFVRRPFFALFFALLSAIASAQLEFLGNTALYVSGHGFPTKGAFLNPGQALTITTQTYPIAPGQSVVAVYTTDNYRTTRELPLTFDGNVGSNSKWYGLLGPFPKGTDVLFYLRANGNGGQTVYDSNGGQDFGAIWRHGPSVRRGAILQWFATDYRTIMRRLPEVVAAGYGTLYLPPPQKSGGGGFSVGYNPFDRFDLGDRFQLGTVGTRYGTTQELIELIRLAKRFGLEVVCDLVVNHNDNRASSAISRYPDLIPEDFHIRSSGDTGNDEVDFNQPPFSFTMLNHDLVGLTDLAHEDGNATQTGAFNLPPFASFNAQAKPTFVRHPLNPQYYPSSRPVAEDVRAYLRRWGWWLVNVVGFDGFRLDATKHTAPSFFAPVNTQPWPPMFAQGFLPYLYSMRPDLLVFGETLSSSPHELREYAKTGMNKLDFPLKFKLDDVFNSSGFGNIGSLANGYGLDPATGLPYQMGGLAPEISVSFVQSHDQGPPHSSNLAHAFTLTRPGMSVVYFDGHNLVQNDYSQFPKPGRYDALGAGGDTVTRLVDARARFARGEVVNRYVTENLYVYERQVNGQGVILVGLNIRGDFTSLDATVDTGFAPGTVLEDLSGQRGQVTVGGDGRVTINVPSNSVEGNANNARGYVLYAPRAPRDFGFAPTLTMTDPETGASYPGANYATPGGQHGPGGSYNAWSVTGNYLNLSVRTNEVGHTAYVRLNNGQPGPGYNGLKGTPEGLTDGFIPLSKVGTGHFELRGFDVRNLPDGLHLLRVRVFADTGSRPGVFTDFPAFFYVRRPIPRAVDGDLTDFDTPLVTQTRAPSSQANRLDILYATNDDEYLYLGLAGRVDASEGLTNGVALLLDTLPGGSSDMGAYADDTGPATRLLSNAAISAPSGFGADFGLASFRMKGLHSAPEAPFFGSAVAPPLGALAGTYRLNPERPTSLIGVASAIAWKPRPGPFDPPAGLEAAIPLRQLFEGWVAPGKTVGLLGYLCTTGESGTTLLSTDPARGTVGGRPLPRAYVTNQFLPPQPGVTGDPGTSAVAASTAASYVLKFTAPAPASLVMTADAVVRESAARSRQRVRVRNDGAAPAGRITLLVRFPSTPSATLVNRRGFSMREPNLAYVIVSPGGLAPGATAEVTLIYDHGRGVTVMPSLELRMGEGVP